MMYVCLFKHALGGGESIKQTPVIDNAGAGSDSILTWKSITAGRLGRPKSAHKHADKGTCWFPILCLITHGLQGVSGIVVFCVYMVQFVSRGPDSFISQGSSAPQGGNRK